MRTPVAILTDTTLCTGCHRCVMACREAKHLPRDVPRRWKSRIDDLSSTRFTTIVRRRDGKTGQIRFVRQQCRHCQEPACVSACLVGALQQPKDANGQPIGPITYDGDRCMGCRYCMMACPFGIPRYTWEEPIPYVRKCDMCFDRVTEGGRPACVEACPEGATIFGPREELIAEAHRRIEENPDRYDGKVYGETEVGGTSVIYVSDVSLDFLAFKPDLDDEPLPELTWAALSKVPPLAIGVGAVMTGVWWIVGRRAKLAEEAAQSAAQANESDEQPSEAAEPSEQNEA